MPLHRHRISERFKNPENVITITVSDHYRPHSAKFY